MQKLRFLALAALLALGGNALAQTTHEVDMIIEPIEGEMIPQF